MFKENNFLLFFFIFLVIVFLGIINFFQDLWQLHIFQGPTIPYLSLIFIIVIILIFVYIEVENRKVLNQFITIVTHKFRTPLTGIRWTIDILQKDITLLEKKDLLLEMQKANERLMEIVDLLVGFAKFDKRLNYAFEAVSLREIVDMAMNKYSALIRDKDIKINLDSDKKLPMVIIDKAKIQFVVDMLLDNALKYTPKGGVISFAFSVSDKHITLQVKDTGIGFSFLEGRKIFGHFFRSAGAKLVDTEGLGLGLYTAKKIVTNHQGKIWAESAGLNKGSTFYLSLPIKR